MSFPPSPRSSCAHHGFTVIEILLVAVIVAVITSLVFASLGSARFMANNSRCASNLKASGLAILLYAAEHPGQSISTFLPATEENIGHPQRGLMWHSFLQRTGYLRDYNTLVCPAFNPHKWNLLQPMRTYGIRSAATGATPMPSPVRVSNPAHYVLLADSSKPRNWEGQNYYISQTSGGADTIHTRHNGKANLFFADGSVRSLLPQEIVDLNDGWTLRSIDTHVYPR